MGCYEDLMLANDAMALGVPLLVVDRFNHVYVRGQPRAHAWQVPLTGVLSWGSASSLPEAARLEDFEI
jgi:hypothetical protein